jgi:hypothetical protein
MDIIGRVVKGPFAGESKSARDAVLIESDAGEFVLRRAGGNPFRDPALDAMVVKTIRATVVAHGYTFLLSSWQEEGAG